MSTVIVEDVGSQPKSPIVSSEEHNEVAALVPEPAPGSNEPLRQRIPLRPRLTTRRGGGNQIHDQMATESIASSSTTPRLGFVQRMRRVVYRGARVISLSCWLDCPSERW